MSVKQAQREIDSREFAEWMAFYQLEPWGREAEDRGHAMVASTYANANRPRGRRPYQLDDFMIHYDKQQTQQTPEQQADILRNFTIALGGTVH